MKHYRIKAYTGPVNSSETIYVSRLVAAGFSEVYQGTEHVYGTIAKEFRPSPGESALDSGIQKAIDFACGVLGPYFGYRSVRCIGVSE